MYTVTISENYKIQKNANILYFRDNKISRPLTKEELIDAMMRLRAYKHGNMLYSSLNKVVVGSINFDENLTPVEFAPYVQARKVKAITLSTPKEARPAKPDDLITFRDAEKLLILKTLNEVKGIREYACSKLNIAPVTLRKKIKKYEIYTNRNGKIVSSEVVNEPSDINTWQSFEDAEKSLINRALKYTRGNKTESARILGISVRSINNKVNQYRS